MTVPVIEVEEVYRNLSAVFSSALCILYLFLLIHFTAYFLPADFHPNIQCKTYDDFKDSAPAPDNNRIQIWSQLTA